MDQNITALLNRLRSGDESVRSNLIVMLYPELQRIARQHMHRERADHILQTTALVHEAYLRLSDQNKDSWENRLHFFAVASHVMRQVLVDYARKRKSAKRGGDVLLVDLDFELPDTSACPLMILEINRAIERLSEWDARLAEVVVMRFFGGLSETEIAELLNVSSRTVKRDWRLARAWLQGELKHAAAGEGSHG